MRSSLMGVLNQFIVVVGGQFLVEQPNETQPLF
jgi:hypothetical protein